MPPVPFTGLASYQQTNRKRFLHPISLLSYGARSLPEDLALEAGDTLTLYQALAPYENSVNFDLNVLEPTTFFASRKVFLKQKDVLEYEAKLKTVLSQLIATSDAQDPLSALFGVVHKLEDPAIAAIPADMRLVKLNTMPSQATFRSNLIYLVGDLHSRGELVSPSSSPSIVPNRNRKCSLPSFSISIVRSARSWHECYCLRYKTLRGSGEQRVPFGSRNFAIGISGNHVRRSGSGWRRCKRS